MFRFQLFILFSYYWVEELWCFFRVNKYKNNYLTGFRERWTQSIHIRPPILRFHHENLKFSAETGVQTDGQIWRGVGVINPHCTVWLKNARHKQQTLRNSHKCALNSIRLTNYFEKGSLHKFSDLPEINFICRKLLSIAEGFFFFCYQFYQVLKNLFAFEYWEQFILDFKLFDYIFIAIQKSNNLFPEIWKEKSKIIIRQGIVNMYITRIHNATVIV